MAKEVTQSASEPMGRNEALQFRLLAALLEKPVEDLIAHPAERLLAEMLGFDADATTAWILGRLRYDDRLSAEIVKCLSRLDSPLTPEWRKQIVAEALAREDIGTRDAAMECIEQWADDCLLELLRKHVEAVPFLCSYRDQILAQA
jgi:hypothetical protein